MKDFLTVSAGLHRSLDVTNTLYSHTILVIAVDKLILKLANFVDQDAKLVRNIRNIIITSLAPD